MRVGAPAVGAERVGGERGGLSRIARERLARRRGEEVRKHGIGAGNRERALRCDGAREVARVGEDVAEPLPGHAIDGREPPVDLGRLGEHPAAPVILGELALDLAAARGIERGAEQHVAV